MATPKVHSFDSNDTSFVVWVVDDLWFKAEDDNESDFIDTIITFDLTKNCAELNQKINCALDTGKEYIYELEYLEILSRICEQKGVSLSLCNFEYFRNNFPDIDRIQNAVLLDICYIKYGEADVTYGIRLLADLLEGNRCQSDAFFVTGHQQPKSQLNQYFEKPEYWPIRYIPFIEKDNNLESNLLCFMEYFIKGSPLRPLKSLAQSLVRAKNDGFDHPIKADDIPNDFLLKSKYSSLTKFYSDSFKALYLYEDADRNTGEGDTYIRSIIFKELLNYCGIQVNLIKDEDIDFKLPIKPGMIFIICLVDFLKKTKIQQISLDIVSNKVSIYIPLNADKYLSFKEAIYTGEGESIRSFRLLMGCSKSTFVKMTENIGGREISHEWKNPEKMSSRTLKRLIKHKFQEEILYLFWDFVM